MDTAFIPKGNIRLAAELASLDYKKLVGADYETYLDLVEGKRIDPKKQLSKRQQHNNLNEQYDFVGYKVTANMEFLYEGVEKSPKIVTGITLRDTNPHIPLTRMMLRHALDLNSQLENGKINMPTVYYFVKQYPVEVPQPEIETKTKK